MASIKPILITGGAGYIGSHAVFAFRAAGYPVIVLDDLSTGHREAVSDDVVFIEGNAGDATLVGKIIEAHQIGGVIHFAGSIVVPESVIDPLKYYRNNTCVSQNLIQACIEGNVRHFVFSSTAAVYGLPDVVPILEEAATRPINPYGVSKLMTEWILRDTAAAEDFAYVALRYFNVAGADPKGRSGEEHDPETHVIPLVLQTALGQRTHFKIYGDDYDTPDGTCIRDYIHVTDLAEAHVLALKHLEGAAESIILNLGNGEGFSVREVIEAARQVTGQKLEVQVAPRRPGDPARLVADASRAREILGWRPQRDDLNTQIADAWRWHRKHLSDVDD